MNTRSPALFPAPSPTVQESGSCGIMPLGWPVRAAKRIPALVPEDTRAGRVSLHLVLGLLEAGDVVLRDALGILGVLRLRSRVVGSRISVRIEGRAGSIGRVARSHGRHGVLAGLTRLPFHSGDVGIVASAAPVEPRRNAAQSVRRVMTCFILLSCDTRTENPSASHG